LLENPKELIITIKSTQGFSHHHSSFIGVQS
jgi:hypothetical protein